MGNISICLTRIEVFHYTRIELNKEIQLRFFDDASQYGYGKVIYLRCVPETV